MATGFYLLDNPNRRYPQTRPRSAWGWLKPTGLVTVHTAEGALDRIAPDSGAENVAAFIATRSDAGGYHVLVDTDSTIDMAPDDLMTWHTAAANLNGPGWGISAACRSVEWDPDAEWSRQIITRMGAAIRAFWERQGFDPMLSARWLDPKVVLQTGGRVVGLTHHGDVQPGDRSDAWARHPRRAELDQMLVDAIVGASPKPNPQPPPEEDPVMPRPTYELTKDHGSHKAGETWVEMPDGRLVHHIAPSLLAKQLLGDSGHPAATTAILRTQVKVEPGELEVLIAQHNGDEAAAAWAKG